MGKPLKLQGQEKKEDKLVNLKVRGWREVFEEIAEEFGLNPQTAAEFVEELDKTFSQSGTGTALHQAHDLEYKTFFGLYALVLSYRPLSAVRKAGGLYFLPLGFVPGPGVVLRFSKNKRIRISAATPDVEVETPTSWLKPENLPMEVKRALEQREEITQGLGAEPTPWVTGRAQALRRGKLPQGELVAAFSYFQWRGREIPFGTIFLPWPETKGVKITKVYNPGGLEAPEEGTILPCSLFSRPGPKPIIKLVRTCGKMESAAHAAQQALRSR